MCKDIENAVAYVKKNLTDVEITHIRAEVDYSLEQHLMPTFIQGREKVETLLNEYGQNNELAEDYWQEEIEHILLEI